MLFSICLSNFLSTFIDLSSILEVVWEAKMLPKSMIFMILGASASKAHVLLF